jgi:hypothetical protein
MVDITFVRRMPYILCRLSCVQAEHIIQITIFKFCKFCFVFTHRLHCYCRTTNTSHSPNFRIAAAAFCLQAFIIHIYYTRWRCTASARKLYRCIMFLLLTYSVAIALIQSHVTVNAHVLPRQAGGPPKTGRGATFFSEPDCAGATFRASWSKAEPSCRQCVDVCWTRTYAYRRVTADRLVIRVTSLSFFFKKKVKKSCPTCRLLTYNTRASYYNCTLIYKYTRKNCQNYWDLYLLNRTN